MRRIFRKSQFKYVVAAAIVLGAAALRLAFLQSLGMRAPFVTFVPAVMLAAMYGGLWAGLLATILSALLVDYFWLEPAGQFSLKHRADWLSLAIFLASGTLISWITEAMHRARARAAGAEAEARAAAERVQAAEKLRAGEERLRFALETSHTGAWDLDLLDHSAFRSLEHDRIFGYEELLPQWTYEMFLEHVLSEDREAVDAKFRHATATHGDWSFECRIRRADGEIRWIWAAGHHRSDSKGGIRRMAGIVQDITERKRAEEALRQSQQRYAAIHDHAPFPISLMKLPEGTIAEVNTAWEKFFECSREEAIGRTSAELGLAGDLQARARMYAELAAHGFVRDWEMAYRTRSGTEKLASFSFDRIEIDGQTYHLGTAIDITGVREAQDALRESEQWLRMAQQAARIGSFEWNVQTDVNTWTPELEAMYGLPPGQFGRTEVAWEQLVHPEDREPTLALVNRTFETGEPVEGEWRVQWADGSVHWIYGRFQLQKDEAGKPLRLTGVNIDITERKQAEAELEQHRHHLEELVHQRTAELEAANVQLQAEVTDRKRAEEDLRESEQRLRLLGDNLPDSAVYQYAQMPDGSVRFLHISAGIERLNGVSVQDVLRDAGTLHRQIPAEYRDRLVEAEARSARELSDFDLEVPMHRRDGQVRWMQLHSRPRRLPNGRVVWDGVQMDITDRKRAEAALRDSERFVNSVAAASPHCVYLFDFDTMGLSYENRPIVRDLGYPPEVQAAIRHLDAFRELMPPEEMPHLARLLDEWRTLPDGHVRDDEYYLRHADGTIHSFAGRELVFARRPDGSVRQILGSLLDITGRKRAEEELRGSELFYRQTLESIPGMVFTTRPDGYCDYQSQQWVDYTGVPMSEQLGDGWNKLLHPDDRPRAYAAWRDAVEERAPYDLEYRVRRHDGQYEWFRVIGRPIRDASRQIVRWFGVAANINDLKWAEQQLKKLNETLERRVTARTEEADHRARQLSELAAELTRAEQRERQRIAQVLHDHLQQLLVGARFNVSVVRSRITEPQLQESLQQVDDLLDESVRASRSLTAELSPPVLRQGTLADIMRWLIQWMRERHDLEVHAKIDDHVDTQAEEIRALLFEASRELLFNVVKHAGVRQACLELARRPDGSVCVTIADRGRGFDPACLRTGQGSATGFGLFSIEERLRFLGGQIDIESRRGAGTRATVIAPLQPRALGATQAAAGAAGTQAQPALPPARPSDIRVLLADDHQVVRDGLAKLLQLTDGIQVVAQASDGQEALDLARQLQPDVVIMDVAMPSLDGIEATRRLHAEHPAISVIGLSMHVEPNVAQAMTAAGAATYLAKTAPPESLVAAVLATKPDSPSSSR